MRKKPGIGASLRHFGHNQFGGPLAEMALVLPFLLLMIFGAFEFARLLYQQHIITKGVQDAARYVARTPVMLSNGCPDTDTGWAAVVADAENIATTGDAQSTDLILPNFTTSTVTVSVSCPAAGTLLAPNPAAGITPIVTVSAIVPVNDIGFFGFLGGGPITLRAEHQEYGVGL